MEDMQKKLEQYRLTKRRKQESLRHRFKRFLMFKSTNDEVVVHVDNSDNDSPDTHKQPLSSDEDTLSLISETSDDNCDTSTPAATNGNKMLDYALWAVYFLVWVTLYIIAIELKFGIVYAMFSALIGIYLNTRTGPKQKGEISAYSVFNKNFESIDGTLKAEHLEKQLLYSTNVRSA